VGALWIFSICHCEGA